MSVSTDMQNLLPKTQEIGRVHHIQERRGLTEQQQAAARFSEHVDQQLKQVPMTPKNHEAKLEPDKRDRRRRGRSAPHEEAEVAEAAHDPDRGNHVDVRV